MTLALAKIFLYGPKVQATKADTDKWNCIKPKNFCSKTQSKVKRQLLKRGKQI
jgi:hypothetical protein